MNFGQTFDNIHIIQLIFDVYSEKKNTRIDSDSRQKIKNTAPKIMNRF